MSSEDRRVLPRVRRLLRTIGADESGNVLIYFTILMPLLFGIVGLSVDAGRLMILHSELQDLADAAAIAGAAELDGSDTAIDRATDRATNLLVNDPRFAEDEHSGVQILTPVFYEELGGAVTTDPVTARFIEVTTVSRSMEAILLPALGAEGTAPAQASATAGSTQVACKVPPLMMCNPNDPDEFEATPGELFRLKGDAGNTQYGPGAFGLLNPPGVPSSVDNDTLKRQLLAAANPHFCFADGVTLRTGYATGPTDQGLNIRFDIYPNGLPVHPTLQVPPAPNVTKGLKYHVDNSDNCKWQTTIQNPDNTYSYTPSEATTYDSLTEQPDTALPRDSCYYSGTCTQVGPMLRGNRNWDLSAYWNYHHAGQTMPSFNTRFDLYLWELGITDETQTPSYANMPSGGETAHPPQCAAKKRNSAAVGGADRRIIYVAIINCLDYTITGGSTPPMQAASYGKFFLTEPSKGGEIYAEFLELVTPANDTNDVLHNIVQLYR